MLNEKIAQAFNEQINAELYSSYLYLSMASWLESQGLSGMASWMTFQADEERMHAMKFVDFINERGGRVLLTAIKGPRTEWKSPQEVFEETCEHESKVTGLINSLVDLAIKENDHASHIFLQWFVSEQVEEEATAGEIRDRLKMVGDKGPGLFMIDQQLGQRPAPAAPQG